MNKNEMSAIADRRETFGYTKQLTHEELIEYKNQLAEKAIEVKRLKDDLKLYSTQIKGELKPLVAEKDSILETIKAKAKYVNEMCSIVFDHEKGIAEYYSEETGGIVHSRPLMAEERQINIKYLKAQGE
jgi:hypothetical protein